MKNYDEYMENIRAKAKRLQSRRRIAASCTALFVVALALTLFVPYNDQLPNVDRYQNSPYYKLIPGINKATYQPPAHKNNYEWLKDILSAKKYDVLTPIAPMAPGNITAMGSVAGTPTYGTNAMPEGSTDQKYEEVTDNQVQGVTEADIFKRSDKYIYYLRDSVLSVYSINKESSREISSFELPVSKQRYGGNHEMYLSSDCKTVTILSRQYVAELGACTVVYSLDVSDPANIQMQEPLCFKGSYITSRVVEDDLLLIYNYHVAGEIDFDKPETFVPTYGTQDDQQPLPAEDIYCPVEEPTSARYTVIAKINNKTLQVQDTAALLSYSQQVYVSQSAIYATYGCACSEESGEYTLQTAFTEITGISYTGDTLDILGTVTVEGSVKDQYSMDEYNSILRVATSTREETLQDANNGQWKMIADRKYNCNLYCIDLTNWEIASSVIAFAPDGEEVTSARFDGPTGYICTAEVVIMSDPVYFFDLSDIHNITYKHTPVIDGYSSSLVNFGDYLLGVGFNESRELKVEVYEETADGVAPIAAYERPGWFSQNYKSYYIDRENNILGLAVETWRDGTYYLLLHFDGYQLLTVAQIPMSRNYVQNCRADIIDDYLYLLELDLQVIDLS